MKTLFHLAFALCSLIACASSYAGWLDPLPASAPAIQESMKVARDDFFEVPSSKLAAAEDYLKSSKTLVEPSDIAEYFGRPDFKCHAPSKLYLVRALYENGGTGVFELGWAGSALVVSHFSLGHASVEEQSVLVACLARAPSAVYSSISGAL